MAEGRAGSGITKRHCQCNKTCDDNGRRACSKSCSHPDRYRARKAMPDGSRVSQHFTSRSEAERWAAQQTIERTDARVEGSMARTGRRFGDAVVEWLAKRERKMDFNKLGSRTHAEDVTVVTKHLLPALEDTRLSAIDRDVVQDLVDAWTAKVSSSEVHKRFNKLALILRSEGDIAFNTKDSDAPNGILLPKKVVESQRTALENKEELATLIDAMPEPYKLLVKFAAIVGTRTPGETFELRAGDIINGSRMSVSRAVRRDRKTADNPTGFVVQGTKTHQQRIVGVPRWLLDEVKAALGERISDPDALLFHEDGEWLDYDRFMGVWRKAVRALPAGKRDLQPYGLRHTCASFLANEGVPIWQVSKQLGHSSTAVTEMTYAHLFPKGIDATATALDSYRV